jgi:hypothetical protein
MAGRPPPEVALDLDGARRSVEILDQGVRARDRMEAQP